MPGFAKNTKLSFNNKPKKPRQIQHANKHQSPKATRNSPKLETAE